MAITAKLNTGLVNLTPHAFNIADANGNIIATIGASGDVARVDTSKTPVRPVVIDGLNIPVARTDFGAVSGIPAPVDGVVFITSTLVAQAARRPDVVSPDTGPSAIRRADGQVKAVVAFQAFA